MNDLAEKPLKIKEPSRKIHCLTSEARSFGFFVSEATVIFKALERLSE